MRAGRLGVGRLVRNNIDNYETVTASGDTSGRFAFLSRERMNQSSRNFNMIVKGKRGEGLRGKGGEHGKDNKKGHEKKTRKMVLQLKEFLG